MNTKAFLVVFFLLIHSIVFSQQKNIAFKIERFRSILNLAKAENKPVLLYAYSPGCQFCKEMEETVFTDSTVSRYYNNTFISYKVNLDDKDGEILAKEYNITSFPKYLYFNAEGKLLHISGGAKPPIAFIQDGKDAFDVRKALYKLQEQYQAGSRDSATLYDYSLASQRADLPIDLATQLSTEYIASQSKEALKSQTNEELIFHFDANLDAPISRHFIVHLDRFVSRFGEAATNTKLRRMIGRASDNAGRSNDFNHQKDIEQIIKESIRPNDQWLLLSKVKFAGGQRKWVAYADLTYDYAKRYSNLDKFSPYETASYINYFAEDQKAMGKALLIIETLLSIDPSYNNYLLQAKLLKKVNRQTEVVEVLKKAINSGKKEGNETTEADKLLQELSKKQQKI
jgi:thioredoxin-related protein